MAKCDCCNKDMMQTNGCVELPVKYKGKLYSRIKVGDNGDWVNDKNERCHDCNAAYGYYHHPGCDAERCPICGGQLISCDCEIED